MSDLDPKKIEKARELIASGVMRKQVAKIVGLSEPTITKYCKNVVRPFEHRGARSAMKRTFGKTFTDERTW